MSTKDFFDWKIPIIVVIGAIASFGILFNDVSILKSQMQCVIQERDKANIALAKIETSLEYIKARLDELKGRGTR